MFIRLFQTCGVTWLFWLYLSSPLLGLIDGSLFGKKVAYSTTQPLQTRLGEVNRLAKSTALAVRPSVQPVSNRVKESPKTAVSLVAPDRLEIALSRRQVTLYSNNLPIKSYPVAIGRSGWETPTGSFKVLEKKENPTWINPLTDAVIPGNDPKNPLGDYWISFWTDGRNWIGFHGTPDPKSVGKAVSHGCVRMYNEDIEELFYQVNPGTQVIVKR